MESFCSFGPAPKIACVWAQYGPYHFARMAALRRLLSDRACAIEIAGRTSDYPWRRTSSDSNLVTLCAESITEHVPFWKVFFRAKQKLAELGIEVCFFPSYFPKQSFAVLLAAKVMGLKTVMMNESHAGTARAKGPLAAIKRRLIGLCDAALVGGTPHKRYFVSMGLEPHKVFTGYDAVDNDHFAQRAHEIRNERATFRLKYDLPEHYFLSLGRFVAKKNLETLLRAFRDYLDASLVKRTHLVMVGSGPEEPKLKYLCHALRLPVYDKQQAQCTRKSQIANPKPGVHFYGFRQIEENPVFYALADAFVLPSLREEWGLVVNEAMASSLPVIVSEKAGCAEDLLEPGKPELSDQHLAQLIRMLGPSAHQLRKNGFVFDPQCARELSLALLTIESMPVHSAMGQAGRRIVQKFSCDNFSKNALLAARVAVGELPVQQPVQAPIPEMDIARS